GKSAEWLLSNHCLQPAYTGNRFQNPIDLGRQKTSRQRLAVHHDVLDKNNYHTIVYVQNKLLRQMAHTDHAPFDARTIHLHHSDKMGSGQNHHQTTRSDLGLLFLPQINARWHVRWAHSGFSDESPA